MTPVFSPKGFVTLVELQNRIPAEVGAAYVNDIVEMVATVEQKTPSAKILSKRTLADFLETLLFQSIYEDAYIASPTGLVQKLYLRAVFDQYLFGGLAGLNYTRLLARDEMPSHFLEAYKLFMGGQDVLSIIHRDFIRLRFGDKQRMVAPAYRTMPLFYERLGYTINLEAHDWSLTLKEEYLSETPSHDFHHAAQLLRPFSGWAICVSEEYAENGWLKYLKSETVSLITEQSVIDSASNRGGRPGIVRAAAANAYAELYPAGHGRTAWKVVLRQVQDKIGADLSLDTLKRAVSDISNGSD